MNDLISQVASELDLDAERAVAGLQRDHALTTRLRSLQGKQGIGEEQGMGKGQLNNLLKNEPLLFLLRHTLSYLYRLFFIFGIIVRS